MPDPTPQQPTPPQLSAALAGSPPQAASPQLPPPSGGAPTLAPGQAFPSATSTAPQMSPQQQQQIAAQQAQAADVSKHAAIGKVASFLFGNQTQYVPDGQGGVQQVQVKQPPGQVFRSLLAGALMGGAMGASVKQGEAGGFLPSFARGAGAGMQQSQQRDQQNYQRAVEQQKMRAQASNEQQKMSEEQIQNAAIREHYNMESMNAGRDANLRDREQLLLEDNRVNLLEQKYLESGATLANVPGNGTPGNADAMKKLFIAHPERFTPPRGMGRVLIKSYNLDDLKWDQKNGWTDSDGKAADPRTRSTWKLYFTPPKTDSEKVSMTGRDLKKYYNFQGVDPDGHYDLTIGQLTSLATTAHKDSREDWQEKFKEQHDSLSASFDSARADISSINDQIRALRDDYSIGDSDKRHQLADLNSQMENARERMRSSADDMNPALRVPLPTRTGERINAAAISKYQGRYGDFSQAAQAASDAGFAPPKPAHRGDVATPLIGALYLNTNNNDHNKALAAAQKDGWTSFAQIAVNPKTHEQIYSIDNGKNWLPLRPGKVTQQPAQQQPQ